jgi:CHAT domain-containing protein
VRVNARYDHLDNVIGQPSILLRAGAGSVVGASWLVRPEVSALFFMNLYQRLYHSGEIGSAFSEAQRLTRRAYPQYADWGAFCLMGYIG